MKSIKKIRRNMNVNSIYGLIIAGIILIVGELYAEPSGGEITKISKEVNFLKNPGFEECVPGEVKDQIVFNWTINNASPGVVKLVVGKEKAHSGIKCLLFSPKTAAKEGHLYQIVPVVSGKKYVLKFWAKADAKKGNVRFVLYQYKGTAFAGSACSNSITISRRWKEIEWNYIPPAEITNIAFVLAVVGSSAYIDDASFSEKNSRKK